MNPELAEVLNFWVAVVALLFGIGIPITLFFLRRTKKELSYEIVAESKVVSVDKSFDSDIQINYLGSPVEELDLVLLRFQNTGNIPILKEEFEEEILVGFPEGTIVDAEVENQSPENLGIDISPHFDLKSIVIHRTLLNPNDTFEIRALVENYGDEPKVGARIAGIYQIKMLGGRELGTRPYIVTITAFLSSVMVGYVGIAYENIFFTIVGSLMAVLYLAAFLFTVYFQRQLSK